MTNETELTDAVESAAKTFGRLEYVVNVAGIAIKHPGGAAFAKTEDWKKVIDINLNGNTDQLASF